MFSVKESDIKVWRQASVAGLIIALLLTVIAPGGSVQAGGTYTGTAFRDYDANGTQDSPGEPGIEGILVKMYDSSGTLQGSDTTDGSGAYNIGATGTGPYRVEFTLPTDGSLDFLEAGAAGGTTVQFVGDGGATDIDAGFANPAQYAPASAELVTTITTMGASQDPAYNFKTSDAVVGLDYDTTETSDANIDLADVDKVGATWGVAYQRSSSGIFVAAALKRHAAFGPLGTGGIYAIDRDTPGTVVNWVDLDNDLSIDTGTDTRTGTYPSANALPADATDGSWDTAAYAAVAKIGIGDIDMDEDDRIMWIVNLFDRKLYGIQNVDMATTPVAGDVLGGYDIDTSGITCTNGVLRPWGVTSHEGKVYVGAVCSGENAGATTADLSGHILEFDPATPGAGFTQVLSIPFNYGHTLSGNENGDAGSISDGDGWQTWHLVESFSSYDEVTNYAGTKARYAVPLISDIEFDSDGNMVIGVMSRWGLMQGQRSYWADPAGTDTSLVTEVVGSGDTLRACVSGGVFTLENNASCGGITTADPSPDARDQHDGPGGGEYYYEDNGPSGDPALFLERSMGALAIRPGDGDVVVTVFDPITYDSNGLEWWSDTTGAESRGSYEIYESRFAPSYGKGNGLGDIEVMADPAPIEIGNRIWNDANGDGIQDPDEDGIADVTVKLYKDSLEVGTAVTDGNGEYYFGGLSDTNMTGGNSVETNTAYEIRVETAQPAISTPGYSLTQANAAQPANDNVSATTNDSVKDVADSDASTRGDNAVIAYTTGSAGANNHGLDMGFGEMEVVSLGSSVWVDSDGDGVQETGEPAIPGATVRLLDADGNAVLDADGNAVAPVTTGSDGFYNFNNLLPGDYIVEVTPPAGYLPTTSVADPNNNSNTDSNGVALSSTGSTVRSGIVSLSAGDEPTGELLPDGSADQPGQSGLNDNNGNMTVDFGFYEPAAIGNYIWVDENSDGYQDEGEVGIPNVQVNLYDADGALVATTLTDSHGGYLFPDLAPGDYYVDVLDGTDGTDYTLPQPGMEQTPPSTLDEADFGNQDHTTAIPNTGLTGYPVAISSGEENLTADFGYNYNPADDVNTPTGNPTAALGDRVWIDTDGDGVQDDNEIGVEGVVLQLITPGIDGVFGTADDDDMGATATTDENGFYLFDNLAPGAYQVRVDVSSGASHDVLNTGAYVQTGDPDHFNTNSGGLLPNSVAGDNLSTVPVVLGPGDVFLNVDFGYQPEAGTIGDTVWYDVDGSSNATQDPSEPGIPGVTVTLYGDTDSDGSVDDIVATTTTDANGNYLFTGLPLDDGAGAAGADYRVEIDTMTLPAGYSPTSTWDGSDGGSDSTSTTTLTSSNSADLDQDFSYTKSDLNSVGDTIWADFDREGDQDANEPGLPGVVVNLYDGSNNLYASTTTDSGGHYLFTDLPNGTYTVKVNTGTLPAGFETTPTGEPDNDDNSESTVTLGGNQHDRIRDFGYPISTTSPKGVIGDTIWFDEDNSQDDQTNQGSEPGLAGITVLLTPPAGVDLGNGDGVAISTVTDANGNYLFTGLPLDDGSNGSAAYVVTVDTTTLPSYVSPAPSYDPDGTPDSSASVTLSGSNVTSLVQDFSYPPDTVNDDVTLGSIGDTIFFDADMDGHGPSQSAIDDSTPVAQGAGDPADATDTGIAGVTVALVQDTNEDGIRQAGEPIIATTTTDANGQYLFEGLPVDDGGSDGQSDADYLVAVTDTDNVLAGLNQSYDSNGVLGSPNVSAVSINAGAPDNRTQDFGYGAGRPTGAIGDTVWYDVDSSGTATQDPGEPGIGGVTVNLYQDNNGDGQPDDLDGNGSVTPGDVLAVTTTDRNGAYLFENLPLGKYVIGVDTTTLPGKYNPTATYEPDGDSDTYGESVTLTETDPVDPDQDFSYTLTDTALGSIGDQVWGDVANDGNATPDAGDVPLAGMTIILTPPSGVDLGNGNGQPVATVTDAGGFYLFDELPAGDYTVTVETSTLPAGWETTPSYDPQGGDDSQSVYSLAAGEDNRAQDFSYPPSSSPKGVIGDTVWFDANRNSNGPGDEGASGGGEAESGLKDVLVELYQDVNEDGVFTPGTDTLLASTFTNERGEYLFTGLDLNDGGSDGQNDFDYLVVVDTATLPGTVEAASTFESDAASGGDSVSPVSLNASNIAGGSHVNLAQDFGYPPAAPEGLIGDTIFFDADPGDGDAYNPSAGDTPIEGVVVELIDPNTSQVIATATTDENGNYYFPGLDPTETYTVKVADENFVSGGVLQGMANTADPNGDFNGTSTVDLAADPDGVNDGVNLEQDFGYRATSNVGSIGNRVWLDQNADGLWDTANGPDGVADTDDDETGFEGVTIDLYRDLDGDGKVGPGEPRISTTTTAADGTYLFDGLPRGDYVVDVTDEAGILNGYWHSLAADQDLYTGVSGVTAEDDFDKSKVEPTAVTLDEAHQHVLNVDFGYYVEPAAVGNLVWNDTNSNGKQDSGEPGIDGVVVTLVIAYPDGTSTTLKTITGDDPSTLDVEKGWYSFGNLLQDEDYNTSTDGTPSEVGLPKFTVQILKDDNDSTDGGVLVYLTDDNPFTEIDGGTTQEDSDDSTDTENPDAESTAVVIQGILNTVQNADPLAETNPAASYDFGIKPGRSLAVSLSYLYAERTDNGSVIFNWETATESGNAGFNLYMAVDGQVRLISEQMIPSSVIDSVTSVVYSYEATGEVVGTGEQYYIEMVNISGGSERFGPFNLGEEYGSAHTAGDKMRNSLFLPVVMGR